MGVKRHPELPPVRQEDLPPPTGRVRRWMVYAGGGVEGGGADRSGVTGGRRFDEAAVALGAEPGAVAADGQDVAVMEQSVEDRGRDDRIGEHRAPLGHAPVRRNEHRARLVAAADELEVSAKYRTGETRLPTTACGFVHWRLSDAEPRCEGPSGLC